MPLLDADRSALVLIDLQARLMPAIADAEASLGRARLLLDAARLLGVPVLATEQAPARLGPTVDALGPLDAIPKTSFDASAPLLDRLGGRVAVLAGWEAHVCVLQTALGLLARGRPVAVVADAVGSRRQDSRRAGLARMERHGAEVVTAEMAVFEWLRDAGHPRFREALALLR